jgi:hypothetical protein
MISHSKSANTLQIKHNTMTQLNYHNHDEYDYKLPITINPLEYGKLIKQIDNIYIIQLNNNDLLILEEIDNEN